MKVSELIECLQIQDPEALVVMSKDGEGNAYSPLSDLGESAYLAESTWSGEIGLKELTPLDIKMGYTEEDVLEDGVDAVVLWPTN